MNQRSHQTLRSSPKNKDPSEKIRLTWMIFSILLWSLFIVYINIVSPSNFPNILVFFILIFSSILSTSLVFIPHKKLRFVIPIYLMLLLFLLYFHQFQLITFILVTVFCLFLLFIRSAPEPTERIAKY